ncbi:MAG: twin-arginine translocase subunit TatC [Actinobacteria bacterium]|nr:twin-arginine translocase subunit TatC [Actinomycetota bacterium]MSY63500.1 twin-arginine translocase subunit TatC [Actinomycetota bacterium]MSZ90170.1 twin-arginine translocase subunit TatC [Actinomycetota bacterium]
MPLLDHLRELRKRVFRAAIAIVLASFVGWYFYNEIITQLALPVCDLKAAQSSGATHCGSLYINGVLGPLNLQIKVALLAGVILSAPLWLYQLWAFIAPGLHRKEKRNSVLFLVSATPFFAIGATLGYLVLPIAIKVLFGFTPNALSNLVKFDDYLDFVMRIILLFGLAFELPIFLVTFNLIGFLRGETILRPWRIWIFCIVLFTAAFTPTADPFTMALLALPLCLLYFMAGGIALLVDRRRDKRSSSLQTGVSTIEAATPIE